MRKNMFLNAADDLVIIDRSLVKTAVTTIKSLQIGKNVVNFSRSGAPCRISAQKVENHCRYGSGYLAIIADVVHEARDYVRSEMHETGQRKQT